MQRNIYPDFKSISIRWQHLSNYFLGANLHFLLLYKRLPPCILYDLTISETIISQIIPNCLMHGRKVEEGFRLNNLGYKLNLYLGRVGITSKTRENSLAQIQETGYVKSI